MKPSVSYDLDGPDCRLILAIPDVERFGEEDLLEMMTKLWEAFLQAREEDREGQRTAWAYEGTKRDADGARQGGRLLR